MSFFRLRNVVLALAPCFGGAAVGCSGAEFSASPSSNGGESASAGMAATGGNLPSGGAGASNAGTNNAGAAGSRAGAASGGSSSGAGGGSAGGQSSLAGAESGGAAGMNEGENGGAPGGAGSEASAGEGGGCNASAWYPDNDGDLYGRSSGKLLSCEAPTTGKWVTAPGDCNDDNQLVFPAAPAYMATSFTPPQGGSSFDYDCSGVEEEDPTQLGPAPACNNALACSGAGFQPTSRTGTGVNPLCGSTTLVTCKKSGLTCTAVVTQVTDGVRCR